MKIVLYSPTSFTPGCGVGDHGIRLAAALSRLADVRLATRSKQGTPPPELGEERTWRLPARSSATRGRLALELSRFLPDAILLEYAPHLGSPRGLDRSGLAMALAGRGRRVPVVVFFHEIASPWRLAPGALVAGCHQRAVASLLLVLSSGAIATSFERVRDLERLSVVRRRSVVLVPIGSNVRASRGSAEDRRHRRAGRGIAPGSFVLSLFGGDHESRLVAPAVAALDLLVAKGLDAHLVVLGLAGRSFGAFSAGPSLRARIHVLGFLPEEEISGWLGASDLYLLPLSDGVSTRRATLAAALDHGLPVLGTRGPNTDPDLFGVEGEGAAGTRNAERGTRNAGEVSAPLSSSELRVPSSELDGGGSSPPLDREFVRLVPCHEVDVAFARAALLLARDPEGRARLGRAGKEIHDEHFSWDVGARRVIEFVAWVHRESARHASPDPMPPLLARRVGLR